MPTSMQLRPARAARVGSLMLAWVLGVCGSSTVKVKCPVGAMCHVVMLCSAVAARRKGVSCLDPTWLVDGCLLTYFAPVPCSSAPLKRNAMASVTVSEESKRIKTNRSNSGKDMDGTGHSLGLYHILCAPTPCHLHAVEIPIPE